MRLGTAKRENKYRKRQTVQTNGCLSPFWLPPLTVLLFGLLLTLFTANFVKPQIDAHGSNAKGKSGILAPLFTPEINFWSNNIIRWANEHDLDPNIVATVMQIESCGNPNARSSAGASGLFQVMPFHFLDGEDAFDPDTNATRGLNYLTKSLENSGGNARLALAGYNGGISIIAQPESDWADETIRYAYWGSGIYSDAIQNANTSSRLEEWLSAGGKSLCQTAREKLGITKR